MYGIRFFRPAWLAKAEEELGLIKGALVIGSRTSERGETFALGIQSNSPNRWGFPLWWEMNIPIREIRKSIQIILDGKGEKVEPVDRRDLMEQEEIYKLLSQLWKAGRGDPR
ncbi:hypothetical protein A2955_03835 [Candidatus Woesebacteria bacterium RIFCSPLOWO2_01_FULL_37_19]|uniref:Uncharacterized protein n=2 Tax=Candidatus Woeseibacteriota TaxID=1752722 RepID=A0A1F8AXZ4_9BACT|nr:MAG: hypothetical protein A2771_02405 [Candidatus Woesebacteria bacterium RIFCSPHIGHO2_01_FULL_38_26b]OGM56633.1 MAG: hypothetical protein A2955_03835 [Candidatus Woesebacteria bacterium RIFCSPLOWO2_01_FULL_37_19]